MADRIKGITIEIDGNTTKLSKALEGVNKDIKDTKASLKDVDKLLKLDPGNIELLRQKEELLNKAVGDTKEKLSTLKDALAQMDASGVDKSTSEYQNLQREIIQTSEELKKLEDAASKSNATLAKIGDTAKKVGDGANKVADATKGLSTAAAGVVAGLGAMAVKAAENADNLNTMAQQTGLSTEALQKMQYAADQVDVSVETIASAANKMKSKISSSEESFTSLGVAVKDANGEYRDTESIFYDVVAAIGQIENETERDIAAMDIFGKSASELSGILDDGGQKLAALGDEAANKGLIISQEDLDSANELNDTLDDLKATLSGSFGKAAVSALQALAPLLEDVAGAVSKVATWLSNLSPTTIKIIAVIAGAIAVISPIASFIATISTAISVLTPIISAIIPVISAAAAPILGIVAAIAAVIAIGVILYKNWDTIKEKASELWENLTTKFSDIKESIVGKFTEAKEKAAEIWDNMKEKAGETWDNVKEKTSDVMAAVKDTAHEKLANVKKAFDENGGGIKGTVAGAWEGIKGYWSSGFSVVDKLTGGKLSEIKDVFFEKFNEIIDKAKNFGKDFIQNIIDGITAMWQNLKDSVGRVVDWIKDKLKFGDDEGGTAGTYSSNALNSSMASRVMADTNVVVNYNNAALNSMLDSVNKALANNKNSSNVTVVLEGDAQGIFKLVKQQNQINTLATGRNALAY